jgi:hypothetical protein
VLSLNNVLEMWEKDSVINEANLASTSVDIAKMHAKYLQLLSMSKLKLKRTELDQKTLLKDKWLYYNGKMSGEEIDAKGWEYDPLNGLKVMKGDMDYYYDSDKDIQKSEEKVVYYKTLVDTLQEIVETLRWRHQTISNIIKWKMFESGN